jgi:EmrB/QacA subfamily drug resistance transporter
LRLDEDFCVAKNAAGSSIFKKSSKELSVVLSREQKHIVIILVLGALLSTLNQTLINPALPSIMAELQISAGTAQYLVSGFTLVNAVTIAVSAFLMDKFSTRKLFISMFALFFVGSLMAGWGVNFAVLLIGRTLQAVCAGVMMPLSMTVLLLIFPKDKRGSAMGMYSFVIMFAPAIGPVVSGVLTDNAGWHVMFLIMAALAAVTLLFAIFKLKNFGETKPVKLDKISVALSSIGLGALLFGFTELGSSDTLFTAAIGIVVGAVALVFFSFRQLKSEVPFLQISVLGEKQFRMGAIIMMLMSASLASAAATLPLYIQNILGHSATISGTVMMPGALVGAITGYFAGTLYDKFGARWLSIAGVSLVVLGSVGMAFFGMETSITFMIVVYCVRSIGLMFGNTPINIWSIAKLPDSLLNHGNAVQSTLRQVGSSLGVAITVAAMTLVTSLSSGRGEKAAQLYGINVAYWLAVGIAAISLILVIIQIKDNEAPTPIPYRSSGLVTKEPKLDGNRS